MNITLEDIRVHFNNKDIHVKGKFAFKPGINVISGANGQGKTTVLNCIYKDVEYEGIIYVDNIDLRAISKKDIRDQISYIKQKPVLFMRLSTIENAKLLGVDVEAFKQYLEYFKKEKILEKKCNRISGGELQIVNLCLGLAKDSKYILIDEPLNNISVINKQRVLDLLAKEKRSMIVVSHVDLDIQSNKIRFADEELKYV